MLNQTRTRSKKANCSSLSKRELKLLKKQFYSIDKDHNGELDKEELEEFMIENNFETKFVNVAIKLFDEDKNGRISFEEFINFSQALEKLDKDPILLHKMLFATFDQDNNGYIDEKEIYTFFKTFANEKISDDEIKNIIENLDENEDGMVSFDEFMKIYQSEKHIY